MVSRNSLCPQKDFLGSCLRTDLYPSGEDYGGIRGVFWFPCSPISPEVGLGPDPVVLLLSLFTLLVIWREASYHLYLFQEVPAGCERVVAGISIMKCLPNVADVKMALEVYKLSLEIERLERERDEARKPTWAIPIFLKDGGKRALLPSVQHRSLQLSNSTISLAPNSLY